MDLLVDLFYLNFGFDLDIFYNVQSHIVGKVLNSLVLDYSVMFVCVVAPTNLLISLNYM